MSNLNFNVSSIGETPARTRIKVRNFELVVDEPASLGGTDLAPNPVEYILAGYAGCINVVAHLTANELGVEPGEIRIKIDGDLNPNRLFGTSYTERAGYQNLNVHVQTENPVPQNLKEEWLTQIENRCPVNDNLINPTPIQFQLNN